MEIFELLESLEDIIERSRNLPFSAKGVVDKEEILDLIKEIRLKLPDELKQAKWVKEERQRILVEAQKEADGIVKEAENRIISIDFIAYSDSYGGSIYIISKVSVILFFRTLS